MYLGTAPKDFNLFDMNRELNQYKYNKLEYVIEDGKLYLRHIQFNYGF